MRTKYGVDASSVIPLSPYRGLPRLHYGVGPAMLNVSELRGIAKQCRQSLEIIIKFHKMEMLRRLTAIAAFLRNPRGVGPTVAFPHSCRWRSTARSRRAGSGQCAHTAPIPFCGLGLRVRVKILGSVNSNHNHNPKHIYNHNPNPTLTLILTLTLNLP